MEIFFHDYVEWWLNRSPLSTEDLIAEGDRLKRYMSESGRRFFESVKQWYLRNGSITAKQERALYRVLNFTCDEHALEWKGGF
jgi:hypothetical protein